MKLFLSLTGVFGLALFAVTSRDRSAVDSASAAPREADTLQVDDFACIDHTGAYFRLARQTDVKLLVLYVFANDCPIVRQNVQDLKDLEGAYGAQDVRFLCLDSAPQDDRESVREQAEELDLDMPILMDTTQCVAEMLGVTRTGEALLIETRTWELLWRGPIDDRLDFGAQKWKASNDFLRNAIDAALEGEQPPPNTPVAKGCALTFLQPRKRHEVEYVRDVAPILQAKCVACHSEGGIGPWKMSGYAKVSGWGSMIREVIMTGRMTPWGADPEYGDFVEDIGLSPEEVRTVVHWVENGLPRGKGEDPLEAKACAVSEWPLGEPDMIITLPLQHIPATGRIPNVDLILEAIDLPEGKWVRAIDLRPSNAEVLHHAFVFVPGQQIKDTLVDQLPELPEAVRVQARQWLAEHQGDPDAELPQVAKDFLTRRAFQGRTYFAKYFPGQLVEEFPEGAGKFLPARTDLMFELHYTTNGAATTDQPRLGLYFHDSKPASEIKVASTWTRKLAMEPLQPRLEVSAERVFDHPFTLYSMSPHMHYRGHAMRYTALLPDGTSEILLSVAEYVFDWQTNYTLIEPRSFPAGTSILCEAVYDNSAQNEYNPYPNDRVRFGPRTEDEMFVGYIVYTRDD